MRTQSNIYQYSLILLLALAGVLFGIFTFRELFPEYKIYQNRYVELEEVRSGYTGEAPAPFKFGIKQIVINDPNRGPETIDRCTSCHVALDLPHFSSTKVLSDLRGETLLDSSGKPILGENENYIWSQVEKEILELRDEQANALLESDGKVSEVNFRLKKADSLENLRFQDIKGKSVDMTKILSMHPLIGKEVRPFEYHSSEEFGCTSCHSGNGRGLVSDRAHGPVFDKDYDHGHHGATPHFTERDELNDPKFAAEFNHKPGHRLLFHTEPILVGSLMEAKCVSCHKYGSEALKSVVTNAKMATKEKGDEVQILKDSVESEKLNLLRLLETKQLIKDRGLVETREYYKAQSKDFSLEESKRIGYQKSVQYLESFSPNDIKTILSKLDEQILSSLGTSDFQKEFESSINPRILNTESLDNFIKTHVADSKNKGSIFKKIDSIKKSEEALSRVRKVTHDFSALANNSEVVKALSSDTDKSLKSLQRGKELFVSQACQACHKISGFSRGGVGPELTEIGLSYPWYIKESIVWPQADLKTSTMPNFKLDHEEIEDLMTFLLSQKGTDKSSSDFERESWKKAWNLGEKTEIEERIPAESINNTHFGMKVFASQGCASCHQLKGFESSTGYSSISTKRSYRELNEESEWFRGLFSEYISGSQIVDVIQRNKKEIDKRITTSSGQKILDEIDGEYPKLIMSFYSPFKFAYRAMNNEVARKISDSQSSEEREGFKQELTAWKDRVHRVILVFIQEYGLGRKIGPLLNWAGVYRDTEWLVGHFKNPASHIAKSIMPVLPFDDSKFYSLTFMLQELSKKNTEQSREHWDTFGFDPERAFNEHCSSCHGEFLHGNGPIADWIYPLPKNLRNGTFLRNLTKERAIASITHGVKGTPMPPWGESKIKNTKPVLSQSEIELLVDWLFQPLPGSEFIKDKEDVEKWQYTPEDVIEDLRKEGDLIKEEQPLGLNTGEKLLHPNQEYFETLYADRSFSKVIQEPNSSSAIQDIFEIRPPLPDTVEEKRYYLKRELYTQENLEKGESLFLMNCSHCHGKEADGTGSRAGSMTDAKPRMLTNLNWLKTRDDLRLLRSIKFGVPGTSMTPWGDKTSTLQRMQMVMFLRTLTQEKIIISKLEGMLFNTFEASVIEIEKYQSFYSQSSQKIKDKFVSLKENRKKMEAGAYSSSKKGELSRAYELELNALEQFQSSQSINLYLEELINLLKFERKEFESLGSAMMSIKDGDLLLEKVIELLLNEPLAFEFKNNRLYFQIGETQLVDSKAMEREISQNLESEIALIEKEILQLHAKLPSSLRDEQLNSSNLKLKSLSQVRNKVASSFSERVRIREKQKLVFRNFESSLKKFM